MRKKLQNSKGYAEPPEFLPWLGLFIFPSSLDNIFFVHTYIQLQRKAYKVNAKIEDVGI